MDGGVSGRGRTRPPLACCLGTPRDRRQRSRRQPQVYRPEVGPGESATSLEPPLTRSRRGRQRTRSGSREAPPHVVRPRDRSRPVTGAAVCAWRGAWVARPSAAARDLGTRGDWGEETRESEGNPAHAAGYLSRGALPEQPKGASERRALTVSRRSPRHPRLDHGLDLASNAGW